MEISPSLVRYKISKDNSRFTRLEEWRSRGRNFTLVKTHYNGIILFPVNSSRISRDITKFKTMFHMARTRAHVHTGRGNTCSKYERIICSPEAREVHFHEMVNHSRRSKWPRMFRHPYSLSDDIPFSLGEPRTPENSASPRQDSISPRTVPFRFRNCRGARKYHWGEKKTPGETSVSSPLV